MYRTILFLLKFPRSAPIKERIKEGKEAKALHQRFLKDLQQVYAQEVNVLEDDKRIVESLKKYKKEVIVKHIFQRARWGTSTGYLKNRYRDPNKVRNVYARIVINFCVVSKQTT